MKRKLIIATLIILGVSMLSGGVLVIAGFFGGTGDINKGLVGHWKFDGGAEDATPNSNDGAVTGASLVADRKGKSNKAYSFVAASSQFINMGDSVDGSSNASAPSVTDDVVLQGGNFMIATNAGSSRFVDGQIDDVRVYNRVLSPAEITRLYESYF